jgi:hypothetical protein
MAEKKLPEQAFTALALYVGGKHADEIAGELNSTASTVRRWMGFFKKAGIIDGGYRTQDTPNPPVITDQKKLEEAKHTGSISVSEEPQRSTRSVNREPQKSTKYVERTSQKFTGSVNQEPQRSTETFTPEEIQALKRVAQRELSGGRVQRGMEETIVIRVRIDKGLWEAVEKHSNRESITKQEVVNRSVELYLKGES